MGQIQLTVALVMIALFTIALIGFAVNFADENNTPIDISDDPEMSSLYSRNVGNITSFNTGSESQYQSILETTIAPGSGSAQSIGPFAITPTNVISISKNILRTGYTKIFGADNGFELFLYTFEGLIVFMLGLFLYKTLRGFPD